MKHPRILALCLGICVCLVGFLFWFFTPKPLLAHPEQAEVVSIYYHRFRDTEQRWHKYPASENDNRIDEAMEKQLLQCLSSHQVRRNLTKMATHDSIEDETFWIVVRPIQGKSDLLSINLGADNFALKNLSWPELTILNAEDMTPVLLKLLGLQDSP